MIDADAKVCKRRFLVTTKKLLQARVDDAVFRKFKKLANAADHTVAGYLRHLVQIHVRYFKGSPHSLATQINAMVLARKRSGLRKTQQVDEEIFK